MSKKVRMLTEAAIMISFAFVLSNVRLLQLPNGGSVTPGSMVPIILFAIRWTRKNSDLQDQDQSFGVFFKSVGICLIVGAVEGAVEFILGPKWSLHPVSILFDYIFAYGILGLSGIFGKKNVNIIIGVIFTVFMRFVFHVISGAIVFYEYAGTQNPWIYSVIYNGSFMSIELAITIVLTLALIQVPVIKHVSEN